MKNEKKDEIELQEEEKELLLEYIKMQNEALKRIYKNVIDKQED
ncbi:hypothetical protein [Neobacillus kokaensis]|uniref:Uncharacterized protein n=1 Tax=Neobacillus kokaensis TaxID=2759023 RepID=A0ABQ3MZL5_9BACI|nr:hypothetical protein [Neobacillus kokaensis]GHH96762.1 hypothetical protein AM1BK_03050 [Neobacillus kokaensis]